ncbi:restriction endonuclease subunit S [Marinoscillum sp.]|uniref:restriction endonuclease subunit S n=1 Tax=Marinoscillum sp. TaxID=2024838 RepID=UPI003BAA83C7
MIQTDKQQATFEKYSAYKDSGVEWFDSIPSNWESRRVKALFRLVIDPAPKNNDEELLSVYTDIGVKPRKELEERGNKASTTDGYWKVKKGDVVVNKLLAWMGAIGVSGYDGVTSPAYDILRARKQVNGRYFHYMFRMATCVSELKRHSRGIMDMRLRLYFDKFGNIVVPFPSLVEQTAIARFLDEKTTKIDQAIAQKEQLIALLKERKQIMIQELVTGKKVWNGTTWAAPEKTKDSGVEWIGEIPEHWEVKKLTHLTKLLVDGTHFSPKSFAQGEYKYVTAKNIKEWGFDFSNLSYILKKDHDSIYPRCPVTKGDVLYIKDGATAGIAMVNYLEEEFSLLSSVALIKPNLKNISSPYLALYLNSEILRGFIKTQIVGGALTRLTLELIARFRIILPRLDEQNEIIRIVSQESSKIDQSISLQEQQIEKLREYKSTLIDSAVTGKIKV